MLEAIEYSKENDGITLYRCYGSGAFLDLPAGIGQLPIIRLSDHLFAAEPSRSIKTADTFLAVRAASDGRWYEIMPMPKDRNAVLTDEALSDTALMGVPVEQAALRGLALREIALPGTLRAIGHYAFYGCRNVSKISIPLELQELGSGCFVDCGQLRELVFFSTRDSLPSGSCMRDVIGDISREIEVSLQNAAGETLYRLVFPEYIEDSIENTPARIFILKYEGPGFRYRQCFEGGYPDLERYDALFKETAFGEYPDTLMRLAADRLLWPWQLGQAAQEEILRWLSEHTSRAADFCLAPERGRDGLSLLRRLAELEFLDEKTLDLFLQRAAGLKNAEAVSFLMQLREARRPAARVSYTDRFQL